MSLQNDTDQTASCPGRVDVTYPAFTFSSELHPLLPSAEPFLATVYVLVAQPQAKEMLRAEISRNLVFYLPFGLVKQCTDSSSFSLTTLIFHTCVHAVHHAVRRCQLDSTVCKIILYDVATQRVAAQMEMETLKMRTGKLFAFVRMLLSEMAWRNRGDEYAISKTVWGDQRRLTFFQIAVVADLQEEIKDEHYSILEGAIKNAACWRKQ